MAGVVSFTKFLPLTGLLKNTSDGDVLPSFFVKSQHSLRYLHRSTFGGLKKHRRDYISIGIVQVTTANSCGGGTLMILGVVAVLME